MNDVIIEGKSLIHNIFKNLRSFIIDFKWSLMKAYCHNLQRLLPELDFHHSLLRVVLAELDDIES
jgi:hypothetical protein